MYFVFGNLPDHVDEKDIREFLSDFSVVKSISFFENGDKPPSNYECLVDLKVVDRIRGVALQRRLNKYYWKGRCIHSHMLLF